MPSMLTAALFPPIAIVVLQTNYYSAATSQRLYTKLDIRLVKFFCISSVSFSFFIPHSMLFYLSTSIHDKTDCHCSCYPVSQPPPANVVSVLFARLLILAFTFKMMPIEIAHSQLARAVNKLFHFPPFIPLPSIRVLKPLIKDE